MWYPLLRDMRTKANSLAGFMVPVPPPLGPGWCTLWLSAQQLMRNEAQVPYTHWNYVLLAVYTPIALVRVRSHGSLGPAQQHTWSRQALTGSSHLRCVRLNARRQTAAWRYWTGHTAASNQSTGMGTGTSREQTAVATRATPPKQLHR